jgi:hypothetical protein
MDTDILQNYFETVYKEYVDYRDVLASKKDEIDKGRIEFQNKASKFTGDKDLLVNELFDLSIKPIQSEADLRVLRDRLINVFEAYKTVLDFPETVKQDIALLSRPTQIYTIVNGEQVDIDKEKSAIFREEARQTHSKLLNSIVKE